MDWRCPVDSYRDPAAGVCKACSEVCNARLKSYSRDCELFCPGTYTYTMLCMHVHVYSIGNYRKAVIS